LATLWTTRPLAYESLAVAVDLGPLSAEEGLELLTARRPARDALEERAARGIVEDLGGHPAALTAAGVAQVEQYDAVRRALHDPGFELALVPPGLGEVAQDVLRRYGCLW
jgi:hypothetical protein